MVQKKDCFKTLFLEDRVPLTYHVIILLQFMPQQIGASVLPIQFLSLHSSFTITVVAGYELNTFCVIKRIIATNNVYNKRFLLTEIHKLIKVSFTSGNTNEPFLR